MTEAHDDLEPLEELPEMPDVPESGERSDAPRTAAPAKSAPRELEQSPLMLRKAAVVLIVSALFPWLAPTGWVTGAILAKLLVLAGGFVMWNHVLNSHDEQVPPALAKIAAANDKALMGVAYLLMILGVAMPLILGLDAAIIVENLAVMIGLITWCQVGDYEKGGKFNPMFGLIIPLLGVGAIGRLATMVKSFDVFALIGSVGVTAAAGIAGYTMYIAIKEAKEHGAAKKKAQMEARKQARKAKNS